VTFAPFPEFWRDYTNKKDPRETETRTTQTEELLTDRTKRLRLVQPENLLRFTEIAATGRTSFAHKLGVLALEDHRTFDWVCQFRRVGVFRDGPGFLSPQMNRNATPGDRRPIRAATMKCQVMVKADTSRG